MTAARTSSERLDSVIALAAEAERADLLAYLDRRIANATTIAGSSAPSPETRELASDRRRQLEIMRDEIAQGFHVGSAAVEAQLAGAAA